MYMRPFIYSSSDEDCNRNGGVKSTSQHVPKLRKTSSVGDELGILTIEDAQDGVNADTDGEGEVDRSSASNSRRLMQQGSDLALGLVKKAEVSVCFSFAFFTACALTWGILFCFTHVVYFEEGKSRRYSEHPLIIGHRGVVVPGIPECSLESASAAKLDFMLLNSM